MIDVKNNVKLLIALGAIILAVLLLGTTKVEAVLSTEYYEEGNITEEMLESIPDTYNVNFKESEFEEALDFVHEEIISEFEKQGIVFLDNTEYNENKNFVDIYFTWYKIDEIDLTVKNEQKEISKKITLIYSNSGSRNEQDKTDIENFVNSYPKNEEGICQAIQYIELLGNREDYKDTEEFLSDIVTDKSISFKHSPWGGLGDAPDPFSVISGPHVFLIFKNDIYYKTIELSAGYRYKVTIPDNIEDTETAYLNYAESEINEYINNKWNIEFGRRIRKNKIR